MVTVLQCPFWCLVTCILQDCQNISIQAYLGYCITPSNYGLYPRIHRWENVSHPDLPWVLHHSITLSNYRLLPQDTSLREHLPSRPTLGIVSLCLTMDFIPGCIAERACPIQAYLGYCFSLSNYGLYPRMHRWESVSHPGLPTWCIASLCRTMDFYPRIHRWESVSHPGLPRVLHHSVILRTSTPGYIAERVCPIQAYLGYCITPSNYRLLSQDTSLREHAKTTQVGLKCRPKPRRQPRVLGEMTTPPKIFLSRSTWVLHHSVNLLRFGIVWVE
jgi:hypothetical protein